MPTAAFAVLHSDDNELMNIDHPRNVICASFKSSVLHYHESRGAIAGPEVSRACVCTIVYVPTFACACSTYELNPDPRLQAANEVNQHVSCNRK